MCENSLAHLCAQALTWRGGAGWGAGVCSALCEDRLQMCRPLEHHRT